MAGACRRGEKIAAAICQSAPMLGLRTLCAALVSPGRRLVATCRMADGSEILHAETGEVRSAHRFDTNALESYMQQHVAGFRGPLEVRQFKGGQSNPTFLLSGASGRYVLRKKPPGKLLASAHQVDREYRVISALAD